MPEENPVTSKDVNTSPEECIKFWMENGLSRAEAREKCLKRKTKLDVGELGKSNTIVGGVDQTRDSSLSGGIFTVKSP
jgi:hypothetical protein